jgi:diguanylate cyclase (GGDEF)-like protein
MSAKPTSGRTRVLVADDDPQTRNLLRELVEGWGYQAIVVEDGKQALALFGDPPDLALLDLMMPNLDGFTLLQRLREDPATQEMPVILLTAAGDVSDKIKGMGLGADDYVTKPFRIGDLQKRVVAALEKRMRVESREPPEASSSPESVTDPLTGVGTFPQLKEALVYEVERSRRYERPFAALIVAMDDSPALYSSAGSEGKNALLVQLAQALRRCFRVADRVFRIDVEAFVVLMPETEIGGAKAAASRLASDLKRVPLSLPEGTPVTLSMGIADFPRFGKQKADDLVRAAHRALERAQSEGAGSIGVASDTELSD